MTAKARNAVFASADWLTAAKLAELAGFAKSNPGAQPSKRPRDRQIFAVTHKGADYFKAVSQFPSEIVKNGQQTTASTSASLDASASQMRL